MRLPAAPNEEGSTSIRFQEYVVAITGGASDIGLAAAERFAAEGAKVVLNGRDAAKLSGAGAAGQALIDVG